ncbi:MAG: ThuA domain-containing protein [Acidobacteria bacterium]|nr:ThuA domain-containing protein [Acidobacteriota bacterium]
MVRTVAAFLLCVAVLAAQYFPPPDAQGGWRTRQSQAQLDQAFEYVKGSTKHGGLLVVHDGWLVYERYFGRANRDATPNTASCGKLFSSLAMGILMRERADLFPDGLDQTVYTPRYLPHEAFPLNDPVKSGIKLGQLLSMSAGLAGNSPGRVRGESVPIDPPGLDGATAMIDANAFATRLWCRPGDCYSYATVSPHIVSAIVRHVSGMELQQYLEERLARPLGWGRWGFGYRQTGMTHTPGGGGIALRATDMLRAGYLMLHNGRWGARQVVPAEYVRQCARPSPYNPHFAYSLQTELNSDGAAAAAPRDAYWKQGSGGHAIYVVPSLKLVIWKLGGRDSQYSERDTGLAELTAYDGSREDWKPMAGAEAAAMRTLEMVTAAFAARAEPPGRGFNVTAHGAKGDGRAMDGPAIQKAIDACARSGGGTVCFPAGNFLSGTLVLKSNVTLHLSAGATLWGSRRIEDYDPLHLIYARNAENIAIEGDGTINGNGDAYWERDFKAKEKRPSPLIRLVGCRNVHIRNVRIRNTPGWGIHPWECDGVYIRGISMITDMRGPNTDGIDPDSSRNVFISDSRIETGDDAICLKTSNHAPSSPVRACENVTVTNCVLTSDDSAIKLGTGSYGDFRNCTFSNCVITGTHYGIAMYIKDGARVEGIGFSNIAIDTSVALFNQRTNSTRQWTEYPIFLDLEQRSEESPLSRIRDVSFSDIRIQTKGRVLVGGLPERPVENLSFRNLVMRVTGFETLEKLRKPRGVAKIRPATRETDYSTVPAALAFANVRGLNLRDVRVIWDVQGEPQDRHAIYAGRVENLTVNGFVGAPAGTKLAAIGLERARRVFVTASRPEPGTPVFLGLSGVPEKEVVLTGNDIGESTRSTAAGATHVHLTNAQAAELSPADKEKIDQALPAKAPAKPKRARKLLVLNVNVSDDQRRPDVHASIPQGNYALEAMGKKTGAYTMAFSTDIEALRAENLKQYDALCFNNTTGVLTRDPDLRASLLAFVAGGKGFVAFHAGGGATFVQYPKYDQFPAFGEMVGGYENGGHPWSPKDTIYIRVEDPKNPINAAFKGQEFPVQDEVFQFAEPYSREKLHILLSINLDKSDFDPKKRRFWPARLADRDFPMAWIRAYDKGRVYYSVFGHNPATFWNPRLLQHFLAGIQYALGDLKAGATPSAKRK